MFWQLIHLDHKNVSPVLVTEEFILILFLLNVLFHENHHYNIFLQRNIVIDEAYEWYVLCYYNEALKRYCGAL